MTNRFADISQRNIAIVAGFISSYHLWSLGAGI